MGELVIYEKNRQFLKLYCQIMSGKYKKKIVNNNINNLLKIINCIE